MLKNLIEEGGSMKGKSAIILDGSQKSALATARSLSARGIKVIAGAEHLTAMTLHSRCVSKSFTYPSPIKKPKLSVSARIIKKLNATFSLFIIKFPML